DATARPLDAECRVIEPHVEIARDSFPDALRSAFEQLVNVGSKKGEVLEHVRGRRVVEEPVAEPGDERTNRWIEALHAALADEAIHRNRKRAIDIGVAGALHGDEQAREAKHLPRKTEREIVREETRATGALVVVSPGRRDRDVERFGEVNEGVVVSWK